MRIVLALAFKLLFKFLIVFFILRRLAVGKLLRTLNWTDTRHFMFVGTFSIFRRIILCRNLWRVFVEFPPFFPPSFFPLLFVCKWVFVVIEIIVY